MKPMPEGEMKPGQADAIVTASDLLYRYPGAAAAAVDGLSLDIRRGEIFGLLGPNGAGKTTTVGLLSTLLRPVAGRLRVCGVDPQRQPRRVRSRIGLVPQDIALYPSLNARENLRYFGRLTGMGGKRLEERVDQCLALVGLQNRGDDRIEAYSGGMQRRANLAAGMIHDPQLLFLDEPTVGIDPQSRATILQNLLRLKDGGTTLVYTTHYMEEAQQLCDRLVIVDGGRVIAAGSPGELVAARRGCANLEDLFLQLTGRQLRD